MNKVIWLDDGSKSLTALNRNYFFAITVLTVSFNIIVHGCGIKFPDPIRSNWSRSSLHNLFVAFLHSFQHSNWQHVLLNMLCFFIAGLYLERKKGSLPFALFLTVLNFFASFATGANDQSVWSVGFSGVNYGLYGYIAVDYLCLLFQKRKRDLFNLISGAVILALIYFAMCFNGGSSRIGFSWYPYDLLHNVGHASGIFVGVVFGVYEQAVSLISAFKGDIRKRRVVAKKDGERGGENSDKT